MFSFAWVRGEGSHKIKIYTCMCVLYVLSWDHVCVCLSPMRLTGFKAQTNNCVYMCVLLFVCDSAACPGGYNETRGV